MRLPAPRLCLRSEPLLERSGSIAPGKLADLVVVDGDPLARITDLRRTVTTYRGGVAFASQELYRSVGIAPAP
jgi:imidazolonepropionase-like amidohydrolase